VVVFFRVIAPDGGCTAASALKGKPGAPHLYVETAGDAAWTKGGFGIGWHDLNQLVHEVISESLAVFSKSFRLVAAFASPVAGSNSDLFPHHRVPPR
jgi:hypothetical protein